MWTNLFEMIEDVWRYARDTGHRVEVSDDPLRRVFGYKSQDREWRIKMSDVQNSILPPLDLSQHIIAHRFLTPDGRRELTVPVV